MTPLRSIIRTVLKHVAIINYVTEIPQMRQWEARSLSRHFTPCERAAKATHRSAERLFRMGSG